MADIVNPNPGFPQVYGLEQWGGLTYQFMMNNYNEVFAFKIITPNWGATKTVDTMRIYVHKIAGDPRWMIQFFDSSENDNDPNANAFLGALHGAVFNSTHRQGIDVVTGWNTIQVNGQVKNNGYPYSGYPTTIVALTLQPNTHYWVLVAPQRDVNEGTTKSNTKNWAAVRFFVPSGPLWKMKTAFSTSRASRWRDAGTPPSLTQKLLLPFTMRFTDGTEYGFPYAYNSWKSSYPTATDSFNANYGRKWREVSTDYTQCELFTCPSGVGGFKQVDFVAGWGSPVMPTDHLRCRLFPAAGGTALFDEIVAPRDAQWFQDHPNTAFSRIRATLDADPILTPGTQYRLEFYSNTTVTRPWWMMGNYTNTTTSAINVLKFGGSSPPTQQHRFRGGTPVSPTAFHADLSFTLATTPVAPSGVAVSYNPSGRYNHISWNASTDVKHGHYNVFRRVAGAEEWSILASEVEDTSFDDYALASGVLYNYGVVDVRA